jgi:hypothetical protein
MATKQKTETKKTIDGLGIWKLIKVTPLQGEVYYLLEGVYNGEKFVDYPVLANSMSVYWVSFRYPIAVPESVKNMVYKAMMRLNNRGRL